MPDAPPPSASVSWQKIQGYLDKLFDALQDLDEAGGLGAAAAEGSWTPKARKKAVSSLEAVRDQIQATLAGPTGKGRGPR